MVKTQNTYSVIWRSIGGYWRVLEISKITTGLKYIWSYSRLVLIDFITRTDSLKPDVRWLSEIRDGEVELV